ncbi:MAG: DNA polymerase III subunit gamma/tau, partial [Candidatus Bipolaricaulota bacterium]
MTDQSSRLSLYRQWRPQTFSEIVGQEAIVQTLRNAVLSNEVAHAYLFSGDRGIGKTSAARILARAVNCLDPSNGEPCNACASCSVISANRSLDIVEIDGASNRGIDHIRQLREEVSFAPTDLKRKVYIIDEVHMLTNEAFNALLKTLEEPPPHAMFVFATTEPHKVPRTIISRCQAFD